MEEKQTNITLGFILLALGMLVTGTINTVFNNIVIVVKPPVPGCCGYDTFGRPNTLPHQFKHPWVMTLVMFIGEVLCAIPFFIGRAMKKKEKRQMFLQEPINGKTKRPPSTPFHYMFALPTICDLTASTLGNIAMLWLPASVWQMMRGAIIIFSGILSVIFLKRKLRPYKWFGMFIVTSGLACVGLAGLLSPSDDDDDEQVGFKSEFIIGLILVVLAQLIAASQMIIEEKFLSDEKIEYDPLNVVFMEGSYGVIFMVFLVLPILYLTPSPMPVSPELYLNESAITEQVANNIYHENVLDAITQMVNGPWLLFLNIVILTSIAFYNYFGLSITKHATAVHRTLIDACRTIFVWGIEVVFGFLPFAWAQGVGEVLSFYSFLQGGGFVLLVIGTLIYNDIIKLPCFSYPKPTDESKKLLDE